ncbi:MAG: tetratricopeptide repeat protein [candidate division Zixibacteria bacterium]|nr:tetratricopeptide repeat protein [candidate division Zixibacteria bacterium]
MNESNKRVTQFGLIFIVAAVILYFFIAGQKQPSSHSANIRSKAADSIDSALQSELITLKASLDTEPHNINAIIRIANIYYDSNRSNEAIEYYEQAMGLQPDNPSILTDCAVMYHNVGEDDRALTYLDKAINIKPDLAQAYFNKGIILMSAKGDTDAAIATWREYIKINPESEQALYMEQQINAILEGH